MNRLDPHRGKAHERLVRRVIRDGYLVSIDNGEEWSLIDSRNVKKVLDEITSVDECRITFHKPPVKHWARIILDSGDETINDYGECEYLDRIAKEEGF